jgi:GT2 family glycosyltransferase/glycosyltransferase involved in cell wall biosynthesis
VIGRSGLFDTDWYLAQNPDVAAAGINALVHYLRNGAAEGRDPNPLFDTDWYLARNPDVAAAGINPLVHYLRNGAAEGRNPSPSFDGGCYLAQNPDVAAAEINALVHFRRYGMLEGRIACPVTEFPEVLPFFRLGPRHRLGYVLKIEEQPDGSPSPIAGVRPIQLNELLPSCRRVAEPPYDRRVDVIVPVYRGFYETRRCIESVLAARPSNRAFGRLVLIDDCGPETELRGYLSDIARQDAVLLLKNPANMGFVASVNRGMACTGPNDVILLNSDTEVSSNWLDRLAVQAHADCRIGTVTPLSNNATICSYPDLGGQSTLPPGTTVRDLDTACAQANALRAVQIPTGVGSCMYIKRACLDDIGAFDEGTFAEGYGEETDFCQRASRSGWLHLLAGDVFVFHVGEASFGTSSEERKAKALAIMRERYPAYERSVARWVGQDPALPLRLSATAALWRLSKRPVVLHVLHSWGGGTEKHVAEIAARLAPSALHLVLVAKRSARHVGFLLLISEPSDWRAVEFESATMADAAPFLCSFGLSQVHVHNFVDVLDQIAPFLRQLALPYDLSIHDYTAICPRINLIKDDAIYCGEPDEKGCLRCLLKGGHKLGDDILWWRHLGTSIISEADRVLCPSIDAAKRIRKYVPNSRIIVAPHEEELYRPQRTVRLSPLRPSEPLRVAVLGTLSEHKGGNFFLDCVEIANEVGAPITWDVIGHFLSAALTARAKQLAKFFNVTGGYGAGDVQRLITDARPHVLFFPQRWPETYSFTLSEALQTGHPILAPDIGAFTERITGLPCCWLYPLETTPRSLVEKLVSVRRNYLAMGRPFEHEVGHWTAPTGIAIEFQFYRDQYLRHSRGNGSSHAVERM